MKQETEHEYYEQIKDWNFEKFEIETEEFTNWDMYKILNDVSNNSSRILDLGTGGGEKVIKNFPEDAKEIIGIDFSEEMIKTANKNLAESGRKNISFMFMNNLKLEFPDESFDIVVSRNTVISAKEIMRVLKPGGHLILHGVDKFDCYELKKIYGRGQAYNDDKPISIIDFDDLFDAGFIDIELVPIHEREYFKNKDLLYSFLLKVPIIDDFSEETDSLKDFYSKGIDRDLFEKYIERNTYSKGIRLIRRYYGITARKN